MASILDQLDRLADEHPNKLLYSYLDLNGNPIECYSYASFLHRTKAIAGHLRREHRLRGGRTALARLPARPRNDLRVFWLRARRIDSRACLSPGVSRFPERPVQDGPHCKGLPGGGDLNQQRLPRISEDESCQKRGLDVRRRHRLHLQSSLDCHGRLCRYNLGRIFPRRLRRFCFSNTHRGRLWSPRV